MSFASAFLGKKERQTIETEIAEHVDVMMQSVAPEPKIDEALENVRSSSLCFGIPMNWALNDADRQAQVSREMRDRLRRFEPRLEIVREVEMSEDDTDNSVNFVVRGNLRQGNSIEVSTQISLFDQMVKGEDE